MIEKTLPYQPYKKDIYPYAYVEVFKCVLSLLMKKLMINTLSICFEVCSKILFLNGEQIL